MFLGDMPFQLGDDRTRVVPLPSKCVYHDRSVALVLSQRSQLGNELLLICDYYVERRGTDEEDIYIWLGWLCLWEKRKKSWCWFLIKFTSQWTCTQFSLHMLSLKLNIKLNLMNLKINELTLWIAIHLYTNILSLQKKKRKEKKGYAHTSLTLRNPHHVNQ